MSVLTEKGKIAFDKAVEHYPTGTFTVAALSEKCGVKISWQALENSVKQGLIKKYPSQPKKYEVVENAVALLAALEEEYEKTAKKGATKANLVAARKAKNDEFYTRLEDIEKEVNKYKKHFKNKTVYLNCDIPEHSNFWKFFAMNFERFQLAKLVSTYYNKDGQSKMRTITRGVDLDGNGIMDAKDEVEVALEGNGDFRSPECVEILKEADIVITNPPFSLFREFVAQLMEYEKKFLIIGNKNAITYKEIFPLIKDNKLWLGMSNPKDFYTPQEDGSVALSKKMSGLTRWFTNLQHKKRNEELFTVHTYEAGAQHIDYQKYDNYDAINVDKIAEIPCDYYGVMGVPITFLDHYNPEQFEIIGMAPERASQEDSVLRIKKYENAIQHNSDGTTQTGNKVNDGPVIKYTVPPKYPYYTSETAPNSYLQVLYARVLIRRKQQD